MSEVKPGDYISCPNCEARMLICVDNPISGHIVSDFFMPANELNKDFEGEKAICFKCFTPWFFDNPFSVHIEGKGWVE
jgi:hypothetical protein